MPRLSDEQIQQLIPYRNYVNEIGRTMPLVTAESARQLNDIKEHRFLLAMMIGPEFVKEQLKSLMIIADYKGELNNLLKSKGLSVIRPLKEHYGAMPLGVLFQKYKKRYADEDGTFEDIGLLNNWRIDAAHHMVIKFGGDLKKADDEVRPYIITQPIQKILNKLISQFNREAEEVGKLVEDLKKI